MNWGKRTVDAVVYGVDAPVVEEVNLFGFDESEKDCNGVVFADVDVEYEEPVIIETAVKEDRPEVVVEEISSYFNLGLELGMRGEEVKKLQAELFALNFYRAEISGEYDELTAHAVLKFQQSQGIVVSADEIGAGNFGPKTRGRLNEILAERDLTSDLIAEATKKYAESYVVGL